LKSGTLKLAIVPGYIRHVTLTKESDDYIQLYSAFPAQGLDLREQKTSSACPPWKPAWRSCPAKTRRERRGDHP
jgi:hypothetical protein